jgi:hypothetical protein
MSESIGEDDAPTPVCICHSAPRDKAIILTNAQGQMLTYFHKDCPVHQIVGPSTYQRIRVKQRHKSWCTPPELESLLKALREQWGASREDVTILEKKPGVQKKNIPQIIANVSLAEWCKLVFVEYPKALVEWPEYEIDPDFPATETPA